MFTWVVVLLCAGVGSAARGAPGATAPPHMKERLAACAVCHGEHGEGDREPGSGIYPRLAAQPAGYLYGQMLHFRSARRTGIPPVATMARLLASLPGAYLRLIAQWYSEQDRPYPPPPAVNPSALQLGRRLVHQGLPAAGVTPCTDCHGPTLGGVAPDTPALAGQYAGYLEIQFAHWRQGARRDPLHRRLAQALTPEQTRELSLYLAALRSSEASAPADTHTP